MRIGVCVLEEPRVGEFRVLVGGVVVKETPSLRAATGFVVRVNDMNDELMEERRAENLDRGCDDAELPLHARKMWA